MPGPGSLGAAKQWVEECLASPHSCFPPTPFSDSLLHCGHDPALSSIYLPLGEEGRNFLERIVIAVSNNYGDTIQTNITVRVSALGSLLLPVLKLHSMGKQKKLAVISVVSFQG